MPKYEHIAATCENCSEEYMCAVRYFCPNSGYKKDMLPGQIYEIIDCELVGTQACSTHNYDPNGEL